MAADEVFSAAGAIVGGEGFLPMAEGLKNAPWSSRGSPQQHGKDCLLQLAGTSHKAEIARWQDREGAAETVTALCTRHPAILTAQAVAAKTLKTQPPWPSPALLPPPPVIRDR